MGHATRIAVVASSFAVAATLAGAAIAQSPQENGDRAPAAAAGLPEVDRGARGAGAERTTAAGEDLADPADGPKPRGAEPDRAAAPDPSAQPEPAPAGDDRGPAMMGRASAPAAPPPGGARAGLPGFAGSTKLYHAGASGFFLDRPESLLLTAQQRGALGKLRTVAQQSLAATDRRVAQAEQELWVLTAADAPDLASVEAKLGQIERLRTQQRLTFIRYVGAAARLLNEEQRAAMVSGYSVSPRSMPDTPPADVPPLPRPPGAEGAASPAEAPARPEPRFAEPPEHPADPTEGR